MTDLYIFRHGDTVISKNPFNRFVHQSDTHNLPILPDGIHALEKTGKFLKDVPLDANFCSPYLRCRESAGIVEKITKTKFKVDKRIGELEGKESFNDFRNRVKNFLAEIQKKDYHTIAVCTHGAVIAAIKHLAKDGKFSFFQVFDYPRPGIMTIIKDGAIIQKNFNK